MLRQTGDYYIFNYNENYMSAKLHQYNQPKVLE